MGGASSVSVTEGVSSRIAEDKVSPLPMIPDGDRNSKKKPNNDKRVAQKNIFDRAASVYDNTKFHIDTDGDPMDEATISFLTNTLNGFFFLQSDERGSESKVGMLLAGMNKEEFESGDILITEGESGSKLYIVFSGDLEVFINGDFVRAMSSGAIIGELALLYDAPRSATIKCKTKCVLWSLRRELFKKVQAITNTMIQVERARNLIISPELAVLSVIDLHRLIATFSSHVLETGEPMYQEKALTNHIYLIERGRASVYSSVNVTGLSPDEIDKILGIQRPRTEDNSNRFDDSKQGTTLPGTPSQYVCQVTQGCLIGISALRGKAKMADGWPWTEGGAECPFFIIADEPLSCQGFTVETFENLFGPAESSLQQKSKSTETKVKEVKFDSTKFKQRYILGSGSFGVVTLAEYRGEIPGLRTENQLFALKCLSKTNVIETGQLRHVLDERKILSMMESRFVLKLYGTYQTPHQLVMVTEALDCGDLWSVIYEIPPFCDDGGLPKPLATFYASNLVLALAHIHGKGVVFRDLKPENIMVDSRGYLRVIDFGFAKQVPYTKVSSTGETKVMVKTYTLCGTPEYLSPELIFNMGHDQSCDLWALGVILHEMYLGVTPFTPKKPDNVTELFTNIAMVKKNGLHLNPRLDDLVGGPDARSLISQLLRPEPSDRIGVQEGSTAAILNHPFFRDINLTSTADGSIAPPFTPDPLEDFEPISSLQPVKPYNKDQSVFKDF